MLLKRSMLSKVGIVFTGNVLSQLFALTFMIIATRLLTKEDYGYVSYILTLGSFFATIVSGGFPIAITRYIANNPARKKEYIENGLFGILSLFVIISIGVAVYFWPHVEIIAIIFVTSVVMFYLGILRGEKEFKIYSIVNSGRNAIKLIILLLLWFLGVVTKYSVIWTYAVAGILMIFLAEIIYKRIDFSWPRYNQIIFKTLLKFSIPLLVTTVFYSLSRTAGIAIINAELGEAAVASFKNALILGVLYGFVPGAIGVVLLPKISSTKEPKVIFKNLRDSIVFSLAIEFLIFILAIFFGKPLIILFLGEKYADVFPIFLIISFGFFFATIRNMFSALWEGTGRPWFSMVDMIVAGTSITLLSLLLVPLFQLNGAAYAYSLGFAFAAFTDFSLFFYYKHKGIFTKERIHA